MKKTDSEVHNMPFLKEFWKFLRVRKKFRLVPVVLALMLLRGLIVLTRCSAATSSGPRIKDAPWQLPKLSHY